MKIYTEVNYKWDDRANKLVEVSSISHDYDGDVILLQETGEDDIYDLPEEEQRDIYRSTVGPFALQQKLWQDYEGPTGSLSFSQLQDLENKSGPWLDYLGQGTAGYIQDEFGIGRDFLGNITPLDMEPFGFLKRGKDLRMEELGSVYGKKLGESVEPFSRMKSKSGFATNRIISGMETKYEQDLWSEYMGGRAKTTLAYEKDVRGEEKRQEELFYDDILRILTLKG